jgi:hypothetical protein
MAKIDRLTAKNILEVRDWQGEMLEDSRRKYKVWRPGQDCCIDLASCVLVVFVYLFLHDLQEDRNRMQSCSCGEEVRVT